MSDTKELITIEEHYGIFIDGVSKNPAYDFSDGRGLVAGAFDDTGKRVSINDPVFKNINNRDDYFLRKHNAQVNKFIWKRLFKDRCKYKAIQLFEYLTGLIFEIKWYFNKK